jgi:hypothetical protein
LKEMPEFNTKEFSPSYGGQIDSLGNVKNIADAIKGTGADTKLAVDASFTLAAGDINIGSVEISDATDNTKRLMVNADGSLNMRVIGSIDGGVFGP